MTMLFQILLACPMCAQGRPGSAATAVLLSSMIAMPFAVAGIVLRIVRRLGASRGS